MNELAWLSFFLSVSFFRLEEPLSLVFALLLAGLFVDFCLEVLALGGVLGFTRLTSSRLL